MKGVSPEWLKERGLVEIRPGVYGRAMLPKALDQPMPNTGLFMSAQETIKDIPLIPPAKNGKSFKSPVKHVTGYIESEDKVEDFLDSLRETDLYLRVQPVSSKNSKEIGKLNMGGGKSKTILRKSDAALEYEKLIEPFLTLNKLRFRAAIQDLPKPYYLYCTVISNKRMRFDYINIVQLIFDMMQKMKLLEDDDFSNIVPVFNRDVYLSKNKCGLTIQVIKGITINY